MQLQEHVQLMAEYNQCMNQKIYDAAGKLSLEQLHQDRGAFFGSIFGTLNHIAVGDTTWLKRFFQALPTHAELKPVDDLPWPESLDQILYTHLDQLRVRRSLLDKALSDLAAAITDDELLQSVRYTSMKGDTFSKNLFGLLMHVFNHQTHHRGQVTTLLAQLGVDYGTTDLVVLLPDM